MQQFFLTPKTPFSGVWALAAYVFFRFPFFLGSALKNGFAPGFAGGQGGQRPPLRGSRGRRPCKQYVWARGFCAHTYTACHFHKAFFGFAWPRESGGFAEALSKNGRFGAIRAIRALRAGVLPALFFYCFLTPMFFLFARLPASGNGENPSVSWFARLSSVGFRFLSAGFGGNFFFVAVAD